MVKRHTDMYQRWALPFVPSNKNLIVLHILTEQDTWVVRRTQAVWPLCSMLGHHLCRTVRSSWLWLSGPMLPACILCLAIRITIYNASLTYCWVYHHSMAPHFQEDQAYPCQWARGLAQFFPVSPLLAASHTIWPLCKTVIYPMLPLLLPSDALRENCVFPFQKIYLPFTYCFSCFS